MSIRPSRLLPLASVLALLFAGCATKPTMKVEQRPGVDLAAYRTFAILPMTEHVPGVDPSVMAAAAPTVLGFIRSDLVLKGYREAPPDKADFAVVLNAGFLPRVNARDSGYIPGYVGSDWYGSYTEFMAATSVRVDTYDQTMLALQIFDAKSKEMVWVGFGTSMKKERASLSERVDRTRKALTEILKGFPVARP